ncbi:hypothetical protein FHL15_007049 [Xylaria flabelliformis]|uniref:Uncharacterized protein n=1 Tax=Xylaria flabelliformis TaxID=2512241 RepID=A0A553HW55_9PEZI|nr:hypothetical protein FHL15_007049 [Xylaria flabelliformis]
MVTFDGSGNGFSRVAHPVQPAFIPMPTYLFSATVTLDKPLGPIPRLQGGNRLVEPIIKGTIYGPAFNATIDGGLAAPIMISSEEVTGNKALYAFIYVYGHASDGSPFYFEEAGMGTPQVQNTRVCLEVGGKYAELQSTYILAQPMVTDDSRTSATVECFSLPLPPTST